MVNTPFPSWYQTLTTLLPDATDTALEKEEYNNVHNNATVIAQVMFFE
jgi:hypothetical protein